MNKPFKEEDFFVEGEEWKELWRKEYIVEKVWILPESSNTVVITNLENGESEGIEIDEISEPDREFVQPGAHLTEICVRYSKKKGPYPDSSISSTSQRSVFWVVKP